MMEEGVSLKKVIILFLFIMLLSSCSTTESREKKLSDDLLIELEEDYVIDDSTLMSISYWFSSTIVNIDNTTSNFCSNVFEGDLLVTCIENKYLVFPSDFKDLVVKNSTKNTLDNDNIFEIVTKYTDESNAYIFHLKLNSETNRITDFTYEEY